MTNESGACTARLEQGRRSWRQREDSTPRLGLCWAQQSAMQVRSAVEQHDSCLEEGARACGVLPPLAAGGAGPAGLCVAQLLRPTFPMPVGAYLEFDEVTIQALERALALPGGGCWNVGKRAAAGRSSSSPKPRRCIPPACPPRDMLCSCKPSTLHGFPLLPPPQAQGSSPTTQSWRSARRMAWWGTHPVGGCPPTPSLASMHGELRREQAHACHGQPGASRLLNSSSTHHVSPLPYPTASQVVQRE